MGASKPVTRKDIVERGRRVLRMETDALAEAERRIGDDFARAVETIARSTGRVIVSGVGKSGLVGRKIAATLTSTGTPANFLHPADSVHGDLGMVGKSDIAILISKSGESSEVLSLLEHLKRLGVCTIALTSNTKSALARHSDVTLDAWVKEEACPHDLAPTTSTTVALAIGDALAIALLEEKGFNADDFARLHPGGALGRRLLTRVSDVMITEKLPLLSEDATMREAVVLLAERRGIAIVNLVSGAASGDDDRNQDSENPLQYLGRRAHRGDLADHFGAIEVQNRSGLAAIDFKSAANDRLVRIIGASLDQRTLP